MHMDKNVGPEDRVGRIVVAIGLAVLIYVGVLDGTAALIVGIVAVYLLLTGLMSRCLLYKVAGIDTCIDEQPYSTTDERSGL